MELRVDIDSVVQHEGLAGLVVALGLDSLDFRKKLSEQCPQCLIVIDHEVCLAVPDLLFDYIFSLAFLITPGCDELAVLHVSLGDLAAKLDAGELYHQSVADIIGIVWLVRLLRRENPEFDEFRLRHVVEPEEIGPGLFQC